MLRESFFVVSEFMLVKDALLEIVNVHLMTVTFNNEEIFLQKRLKVIFHFLGLLKLILLIAYG